MMIFKFICAGMFYMFRHHWLDCIVSKRYLGGNKSRICFQHFIRLYIRRVVQRMKHRIFFAESKYRNSNNINANNSVHARNKTQLDKNVRCAQIQCFPPT